MVEAIIPIYGRNGGNATLVYDLNGQKLTLNKSVKSYLVTLARDIGKDVYNVRKMSKKALRRTNGVPLVFSECVVLIPVKVRKPITKSDGSYGYINLACIEDIINNENTTTIKLINNINIEALITTKTLNTKIIESNYLKDIYIRKMNNFNNNNLYKKLYENTLQNLDISTKINSIWWKI